MPSPFPGMDPYLESPDWFPDLHGSLIFLMKETLRRSLPRPYYAQSFRSIASIDRKISSSIRSVSRTGFPRSQSPSCRAIPTCNLTFRKCFCEPMTPIRMHLKSNTARTRLSSACGRSKANGPRQC